MSLADINQKWVGNRKGHRPRPDSHHNNTHFAYALVSSTFYTNRNTAVPKMKLSQAPMTLCWLLLISISSSVNSFSLNLTTLLAYWCWNGYRKNTAYINGKGFSYTCRNPSVQSLATCNDHKFFSMCHRKGKCIQYANQNRSNKLATRPSCPSEWIQEAIYPLHQLQR